MNYERDRLRDNIRFEADYELKRFGEYVMKLTNTYAQASCLFKSLYHILTIQIRVTQLEKTEYVESYIKVRPNIFNKKNI